MLEKIKRIHERSRGTYGSPRIHAELRAQGIRMSKKRVARLMREAGLEGVSRRQSVRTSWRREKARPAPDLVDVFVQQVVPGSRRWGFVHVS